MTFRKLTIATAVTSALAALPLAQAQETNQTQKPIDILTEWEYDELYAEGFSAEEFMDADVHDVNGEEIGEVADLVVDPDGNNITGMVLEVGGFLDIGDTHLVYPYDTAEIGSIDSIQVAIDEGNVEEFSLFEGAEDIEGEPAPGRQWRVSELIDDYAYAAGEPYGWVEDVIINREGEVLAVVVQPDVANEDVGYYAWPFYGYDQGFDPGLDYYDIPYEIDELAELEPFEYEVLEEEDLF